MESLIDLEKHWYESLASGSPDYGVYAHPLYLAEATKCYELYSKKYLAMIGRVAKLAGGRTVREDIGDVGTIVDLGCGTGMSTASIKRMWPHAEVWGTQVRGAQFDVARERGIIQDFQVTDELSSIPLPVDVVFASEYFEHFRHPLGHLSELQDFLEPNAWLIASTYGRRAIGHFDSYQVDGSTLKGGAVSSKFNARMRVFRYKRVETGFWNGRPTYWKR